MGLEIALIGAGAIAEEGYIPAFSSMPDISLQALVDINKDRLNYLRNKFNLDCCITSFDEILGKVNCVIIATPPHTHEAIARKAFEAGCHVLCEKPLSNTAAECERIIHYAQQANRKLAVAHAYRFAPNRKYLHSIVQEKKGRILGVNVQQGSKADWPAVTGYSFRKELVPGGVLLNEGIHSLDFICWLMGYPDSIEYLDDAIGGLESNCSLTLVHGSTESSFLLSRTCSLSNTIVVYLEEGSITIPIYNMNKLTFQEGSKQRTVKMEYADFDITFMFRHQLEDLRDAIEKDKEPFVSGVDGLQVVKIVEGCYSVKKERGLPETAPIPGMVW